MLIAGWRKELILGINIIAKNQRGCRKASATATATIDYNTMSRPAIELT